MTRYASQPKVVVLVHPAGVGYTLRRQTGALERVANVHGVSVTTKARTTPGFLYLTLTDSDSAVRASAIAGRLLDNPPGAPLL